jgi:transcriptional regulator with XRE-family HTH domain
VTLRLDAFPDSEHAPHMVSTTSESVATAIRMQLVLRKMTGRTLASRIGMGERSLSKRLTGVVTFKADEVARIADALDVPVGELLRSPDHTGQAAENSGQHTVSSAPAPEPGESESRERLDRPAAYPDQANA